MIVALLLCLVSTVVAQEEGDPLSQIVRVMPESGNIQNHLDYIDQQVTQSISYSSSRFDNVAVTVDQDVLSIREYLDVLFLDYDKVYLPSQDKIVVVVQGVSKVAYRRLYGYIRDVETGEVLAGALVVDVLANTYSYTNNVGYYNIKVRTDLGSLLVSYLGYSDTTVVVPRGRDMQLDVSLLPGARIAPVIIEGRRLADKSQPERNPLDLDELAAYASLSGELDILQGVKAAASVQSGGEGQSGFYVRGGTPDQNLILLDGVAMYEVSHTAGIASIFNGKSIRDATLTSEGFDARYGGRMSSVLDIHLKDGHYKAVQGSVDMGVFGGGVHLEGPLVEGKTAFNLSAKTSWVNGFLDQILPPETQYDDLDLAYSDLTFKLSHRFTPTSRLSFTVYRGSDDVQLISENRTDNEGGDFFSLQEDNALTWGSELYALNYEQVVGDKWLIRGHAGSLDYSYGSSSIYEFRQFIGVDGSSRSLSVNSTSGIQDNSLSWTADYFASTDHKLTFGAGLVDHEYRPVIKSTNTRENTATTTLEDSSRTYNTLEWAAHISNEVSLANRWFVKGGLRLTGFVTDEKARYLYLEPRLLVRKSFGARSSVSLSASRMTQNVHLLVNPGIGLPSDLWVPSTDEIAPEISDQLSLRYNRSTAIGLDISAAMYVKQQRNLLEYSNPLDLFYTILNNDNIVPVEVQNREWEERVSVGSGLARGLEVRVDKPLGDLRGWFAYSLSRNDRRFDDVNNGAAFPFRFDRTHDFNIGLRYFVSDHFDVTASFVYGTGNAITLALTEISDGEGGAILLPGPRNDFRLPAYHHLDLRANYRTAVDGGGDFIASLSLYNIYNRYNPYYIYLFDDELNDVREFRQVSLFPFIPSVNFSYDF
jgi:hypothetical protein